MSCALRVSPQNIVLNEYSNAGAIGLVTLSATNLQVGSSVSGLRDMLGLTAVFTGSSTTITGTIANGAALNAFEVSDANLDGSPWRIRLYSDVAATAQIYDSTSHVPNSWFAVTADAPLEYDRAYRHYIKSAGALSEIAGVRAFVIDVARASGALEIGTLVVALAHQFEYGTVVNDTMVEWVENDEFFENEQKGWQAIHGPVQKQLTVVPALLSPQDRGRVYAMLNTNGASMPVMVTCLSDEGGAMAQELSVYGRVIKPPAIKYISAYRGEAPMQIRARGSRRIFLGTGGFMAAPPPPAPPPAPPAADFGVARTASPLTVTQNNAVTQTVTVVNNGPDSASALLSYTVPVGFTFLSASQGAASIPQAVLAAGVTTGTMASGATLPFQVVMRADTVGNGQALGNAAIAAQSPAVDPVGGNNTTASVTVDVSAGVANWRTQILATNRWTKIAGSSQAALRASIGNAQPPAGWGDITNTSNAFGGWKMVGDKKLVLQGGHGAAAGRHNGIFQADLSGATITHSVRIAPSAASAIIDQSAVNSDGFNGVPHQYYGPAIITQGADTHWLSPATGINGVSGPLPNMCAWDLTNNVKLPAGKYVNTDPINSHVSGGFGNIPGSDYRFAQIGNRMFFATAPNISSAWVEYDPTFAAGGGNFGRSLLVLPQGIGVGNSQVGVMAGIPTGQLVGIDFEFTTDYFLKNGALNAWVMDVPALGGYRNVPLKQFAITGLEASIGWCSAFHYVPQINALVLIPDQKTDGHYYIIPWTYANEAAVPATVAATKVVPAFESPLTTLPQVGIGVSRMYGNVQPFIDGNGDKYLVLEHDSSQDLTMLRLP
jgi:hypothetical protein